ncbi:ABC transporter permease [Paracoccus laeviglucosivorans]|uniref:Amino acid ABC transporter membrane protein 2, PAAT family n=1 Tax=Paracoccus laeviglucosivorans TaxID=1197861 RepID=A0A521BXA4_9RHOB|nr:ABC transporter permease subunit [Paracoccus laeviglucosivorans]SMO51813.1 amino acid ABC transporter membrane protein 2, PAAT family [Paracoccus laeviglucosivorans]
MSQCLQTLQDYGLRSLGIGERLLPRTGFSLCEHFALIGSGLIWNIYFGALALFFGFFLANGLALAKISENPILRKPAEWFIFLFRGSPLFIQFFVAYEALVQLPRAGIDIFGLTVETGWITRAWAGALFVLTLNTAAYSAEIFYGALRNLPKGELEAADAYGMTGWTRYRRVVWPNAMRLAWPAYTNEAIFLFHATTLVFFSSFPAFRQQGDALYYASFFADKTFNPFIAYPIVAGYFILLTLCLISLFGVINRRLNRHLPGAVRRIRYRPNLLR